MSPYIQGYLDSLCGPYSIINAMRLIYSAMSRDEITILFKRIMQSMEERRKLSSIIIDGVCETDIQYVLKQAIEPHYSISWQRPFKKNGSLTIEEFWREIQWFLLESENRAVIALLSDSDGSHWTVISTATERRIHFFDSAGMKWINRRVCTVREATLQNPYAFEPQETFFLSRLD